MSTAATLPVPARRYGRAIDGIVTILACVAVWQALYAYAGEAAISSPFATLGYLAEFVGTRRFWDSFAATMTAFVSAFLISAVLGILAGLGLGLWRFAGEVGEPVIAAIYSIPKVTLYPMVLLIFGLGISAKVAFGVIHGVIPIILFTLGAVKTINPVMLRTARAMRLTPAQTIRTVLAPAALPEMATGLRVGFSLTLLGVLIGEMFASQRGLGFLIINGISLHNVRMTTAIILVVVLFAIAANGLLLWLDRRLVRHV